MKRKAFLIIRPLVIVYLAINALFYFFQSSLLFFPSPVDLKECSILNSQYISLIERDEVRYIKAINKSAKANLILFHGNGGSACHRANYIKALSSLPLNIILAEYPGYTGDSGELSERNFLINAQKLFNDVKSDKLPVFIYGESLGTGVATYLASKNEISGLILNSPYTSISDMAKFHYPFLLVDLLNKNTFESKLWAKDVKVSPLVFQGALDQVVPIENVELQLKNFKEAPIYHRVEKADHNDLIAFQIVFREAIKYIQNRL